MILLVNGAFGIGKTTVARLLVMRLPRAILFDPEIVGIALQRALRTTGREVDDFQDLAAWRWLTVAAIRMTRLFRSNIVVPMAFSNVAYLNEIQAALRRFEPRVFHFCLRAPEEAVHERLRARALSPKDSAWQHRRASECCAAHESDAFAIHVVAFGRTADEIADELLRAAGPVEP